MAKVSLISSKTDTVEANRVIFFVAEQQNVGVANHYVYYVQFNRALPHYFKGKSHSRIGVFFEIANKRTTLS